MVRIRGDGLAACCCVRLLEQAGLAPEWEIRERPRVPALMVGAPTQKLLSDVFGRDDLFEGLPRIEKRVVAWGGAQPVALPHSAVVVSEQILLDRIRQQLPVPACSASGEAAWTILASRPLPAGSVEQGFGSRTGMATEVRFRAGQDLQSCWVESLEEGWLFLVPGTRENGWLLSVGDSCEKLLGQSRMVAGEIAETGAASGCFPCYPRIVEPLGEPGWLACGTAALGFDPLGGDGAGYASREAILASAVVRAAADGADASALAAHYSSRLIAGFERHLQVCRQFYETGGGGAWWTEEAAGLHRGLEWCRRQSQNAPPFRFRLSGFALEAVE